MCKSSSTVQASSCRRGASARGHLYFGVSLPQATHVLLSRTFGCSACWSVLILRRRKSWLSSPADPLPAEPEPPDREHVLHFERAPKLGLRVRRPCRRQSSQNSRTNSCVAPDRVTVTARTRSLANDCVAFVYMRSLEAMTRCGRDALHGRSVSMSSLHRVACLLARRTHDAHATTRKQVAFKHDAARVSSHLSNSALRACKVASRCKRLPDSHTEHSAEAQLEPSRGSNIATDSTP